MAQILSYWFAFFDYDRLRCIVFLGKDQEDQRSWMPEKHQTANENYDCTILRTPPMCFLSAKKVPDAQPAWTHTIHMKFAESVNSPPLELASH